MCETRGHPVSCDASFAATLEEIDRADAFVSDFLTRQAVCVDRFAMRILLREAMLNAVIHGSGKDPRKRVELRVCCSSDCVELVVEDGGPGFIWQDRETQFDVVGDGGRGLALMQIYATEMEFNSRGNRITLRRACDSSEACASTSRGNAHDAN